MGARVITSYQAPMFRSFDELQDYIDNLGAKDTIITTFHGYTPVTFVRKIISEEEYNSLSGIKEYYTVADKHDFNSIMYRAKEETHQINQDLFLRLNVVAFWPMHKLPEDDPVQINNSNTLALEWGDKHSYFLGHAPRNYNAMTSLNNPIKITSRKILTGCVNYFQFVREFQMSGMSFAGDTADRMYIEAGFTYEFLEYE